MIPEIEQGRGHSNAASNRKAAGLTLEEMTSDERTPPRHQIDAPEHGLDFTIRCLKDSPLDSGEHVLLQHHSAAKTAGKLGGDMVEFGHRYSAASN